MKRRTFVRSEAQNDISDAMRWYESRESGLGKRFIHQIRTTLQQIGENPLRFPVISENIRRALVQKFPYALYYINEPNHISIVAVLHQHRRPDTWELRK